MGSTWLTALVAATTVTLVTTPLMRRLARNIGLVDHPAADKSHHVAIPCLGGVAIAAGVLAGLALVPGLGWRMGVVALVASSLCALGLLDDHRSLAPGPRLAVELVAAVVTLALGLHLEVTGVALLDAAFTLVWIVALTNAANLLDNMDGLAAGVGASIAVTALLLSGGLQPVATLAAAVAGACLGFLAYNKPPASIYMGDAGSLVLGYLLAVITIAVTRPLEAAVGFAVPLMLTAVPLADTTTVVLARLRRGRSIAQGGKDHLSHRLVRRGLPPGRSVSVLVAVSLCVGLLGALAGRGDLPLLVGSVAATLLLGLLLKVALPAEVYDEPVIGLLGRHRFPAGFSDRGWVAVAAGLIPGVRQPSEHRAPHHLNGGPGRRFKELQGESMTKPSFSSMENTVLSTATRPQTSGHSLKPSVFLVLDHPVQHFSEAFRRLAKSTTVDSLVCYWTEENLRFDSDFAQSIQWDVELMAGYARWAPPEKSSIRRAIKIYRLLKSRHPTAVLCYGWGTPITWITIFSCIVLRIPLLFYGDSTWQHSGRRHLRIVRNVVLRLLFRAAHGAVATGTFNRDFYVSLGMKPSSIVNGVCPVDLDAYRRARRSRKRCSGRVTIGFAGKLTHRKGTDELLEALALLPEDPPWAAWIIGDGPERFALEQRAGSLGLGDRVDFLGFSNTSEMPSLLASCDVVVVPSRWDLRVLVATEAMATGAAVIISSGTAVWGPGDMIEHGHSGLVYESGRPEELAEQLRCLIEEPSLREAISSNGAARAERQGPDEFAQSVEAAVELLA
jgi:UDP-GlcNAc:undecaprenyl-phosphate GlcNAc-1-phosphate transferase